jgi:hypothetical protein
MNNHNAIQELKYEIGDVMPVEQSIQAPAAARIGHAIVIGIMTPPAEDRTPAFRLHAPAHQQLDPQEPMADYGLRAGCLSLIENPAGLWPTRFGFGVTGAAA